MIRFSREKYFPSSWNTGTEKFCSLFHRYGYIYKPVSGGNWLSADENWQLTDTEILKAIACVHKFYIGARSGKASRFAVLDIDSKSKYHNLEEFGRLKDVLAKAGLSKIVPYQSSSSGGWHLYIFFDEPVSSRDLNKQLTALMQLSNFKVQKGQLEIFPNPGESRASAGHGLRLPLQPGWAWLNQESMEPEILRDEISALEALDLFLLDLDQSANSHHHFHRLKRYVEDIPAAKDFVQESAGTSGNAGKRSNVVSLRSNNVVGASEEALTAVRQAFGALPPGIRADLWSKGRDYYAQGLTGPGQRAEAIFTLGHYLFYGDPEINLPALGYGCEQERQWLLEEIISTRHNGQSQDLNKGRADALAQIRRAAQWRPAGKEDQEHQAYTPEVPISWVLENQRRKQDARERIRQAYEELKEAGRVITASELREKAGCSWTTLYKHEDIWKAEVIEVADPVTAYEQISEDLFAISTHGYNAVVGASSQEVCSVSQACSFDVEVRVPAVAFVNSDVMPEKRTHRKKATRFQKNVREDLESWRISIAANLPPEFAPLSVFELTTSLSFLLFGRGSGPDFESEQWISSWGVSSNGTKSSAKLEKLVNWAFTGAGKVRPKFSERTSIRTRLKMQSRMVYEQRQCAPGTTSSIFLLKNQRSENLSDNR